MSNLYQQQLLKSLRSRGLRQTFRYAWARALGEDSAPVPLGERLWLNRHGFKPASYFVYAFDTESHLNRLEFMSDSANGLIGDRNRRFGAALRNKLLFHRVMNLQHAVQAPELVGFVEGDRVLRAEAPFRPVAFLDLFDTDDELVFKPVTGSRSSGVFRMHRDSADSGVLRAHRSQHGYIVVRVAHQAPYAAAIHGPSTNTVRVIAMRDPDSNEVFVPRAVHRFGVSATGHVDNWSAGGISCHINVEDGIMGSGVKHPRLTGWRVVVLDRHPESSAPLLGVRIPRWDELLATIHELMNLFPDVTFAAWDMLATESGWSVIEGNEIMAVHLIQVHGGLLRDPRVARFISFHTGA